MILEQLGLPQKRPCTFFACPLPGGLVDEDKLDLSLSRPFVDINLHLCALLPLLSLLACIAPRRATDATAPFNTGMWRYSRSIHDCDYVRDVRIYPPLFLLCIFEDPEIWVPRRVLIYGRVAGCYPVFHVDPSARACTTAAQRALGTVNGILSIWVFICIGERLCCTFLERKWHICQPHNISDGETLACAGTTKIDRKLLDSLLATCFKFAMNVLGAFSQVTNGGRQIGDRCRRLGACYHQEREHGRRENRRKLRSECG